MEEDGGIRLSKRFSDKGGEVDYKTKAGTAWSHSYLNQKPWHPLSYPNQRRKWIAEQTHAERQRRADEVAREYAQEQEFFRQTSVLSQKEKEKVDMMQAVSFMYVRPPGYNAESAKAAEVADERKKLGESDLNAASSSSMPQVTAAVKEEKKKPRAKDVFGHTLPTEEEFAVLKNAPRLETGVAGRAKPFAVEVRNVKCVRCGNFGHQSGDRDCPLKDSIMPNDENRLKRDDPLTAMIAHMDSSESLKWELKQKPGLSPPRGGFMPDDPNQQIVADDIFDEYGGFLGGVGIPELLTLSSLKHKKNLKCKRKHKRHRSSRLHYEDVNSTSESDDHCRNMKTKQKSRSKLKEKALSLLNEEENIFYKDDNCKKTLRTLQQHKSARKRKESSRSSSMLDDSTSDGGTHKRRSRRRKRNYKSTKNEDSSHSSSSDDSECHKHYGRSRYKVLYYSEQLDKYRNHVTPHRSESRVNYEDRLADGERRSRERKGSRK